MAILHKSSFNSIFKNSFNSIFSQSLEFYLPGNQNVCMCGCVEYNLLQGDHVGKLNRKKPTFTQHNLNENTIEQTTNKVKVHQLANNKAWHATPAKTIRRKWQRISHMKLLTRENSKKVRIFFSQPKKSVHEMNGLIHYILTVQTSHERMTDQTRIGLGSSLCHS